VNVAAILALLGDLYHQLQVAQERIQELEQAGTATTSE
jgi:hypothetical protein